MKTSISQKITTTILRGMACALFAGALCHPPRARALDNGLALSPPMGWNSWNFFGCSINETIVKQEADAMVSSGMKAAGYEYINLDDCWQNGRDASGNIVADPTKFPSGIASLAQYVHSKGLKLGLYTDAGTQTCQGRPGSYGFYPQDANTYSSWGVDYIKVDWCNTTGLDPQTQYQQFRDALANTSIEFSICDWGTNSPWLWGPATGNLWRTTGDINDSWASMTGNMDSNSLVAAYAGPGGWNDPDMLEVGNGGMTAVEDQTHFSMWAMMAAPLIMGNDLTNMPAATKAILTNAEVIAVDQDILGNQGVVVSDNGAGLQVWSKKLSGGALAVALFNRSAATASLTAYWSVIGLPAGSAAVRDLWTHSDQGTFTDSYTASVPSHGVVMLKLVSSVPGFTVGAYPGMLSIKQGSSDVSTLTAAVSSGYNAAISLSASGQPAGVTVSFSPTSIASPGNGSSTMTLAVSPSVIPGLYPITVTGTGGSTTSSTTSWLSVLSNGTCLPTAIVPYVWTARTNWMNLYSITVTSGTAVNLGPQPTSGGTWSWAGSNGYTSTSREIDNIPLSAGANTYTATYTDMNGCVSTQGFVINVANPTPSNGNSVTVSSSTGFYNTPMSSAQSGTFTATFDASPSLSPINAVIALSKGAQTAYTGLACIARFNTAGDIDAYNGTAYQAASVIPYAKNTTYHFRMVVTVPANTYSVYVTPPSSSELTVGLNYKFRTAATSLDTWTIDVNATPGGSVTVSNRSVSGSGGTVAAPSFSPGAGTYTTAQTVIINDSTSGASIRYTTDGVTAPTETVGTLYTGSISISATTTLKAIAFKTGMTDSPVTSGTYTIIPPPSAPVFSPGAGTYTSAPTVTITSSGATSIHYTTNGNTPTSSSTLYTGPILVSTSLTLEAIGTNSSGTSPVTTGQYTINAPPQVTAPTFSPPAGTYTSAQTVTISTTTSGASIRYTTDGSTPSETAGTVYSSPVNISITTTLKAIAFETGMTDSTVTTGIYTIGSTTRSLTGTSSDGWHALALTSAQAGTFTATFDATPTVSPENAVVGLSKGVATAYTGLSCIARFNTSGQIDAYNGTAYGTSTISYAKNITYHFRLVVNVTAHTYSVYVTPAGGTELTVGLNYVFRVAQASLDTWDLDVNSTPSGCSLTANNLNP